MATLKEKMAGLVNRVNDTIVNAQQTYEKDCETLECLSLADLRKCEDVKAIRNAKTGEINFSGALDVVLKNVPKSWIFVTEKGEYITIDEKALKQKNIEIQLKTKTGNHIITTTKYKVAKINITTK